MSRLILLFAICKFNISCTIRANVVRVAQVIATNSQPNVKKYVSYSVNFAFHKHAKIPKYALWISNSDTRVVFPTITVIMCYQKFVKRYDTNCEGTFYPYQFLSVSTLVSTRFESQETGWMFCLLPGC